MKYGIIFLVLVSVASGLLLQDSVPVNDWIGYKGSPERIGSSDGAAPDTLYLQWKLDTNSELWASPVVKDKKVYQVALEKLYCIDLDTGNVLWVSDVPVYRSAPFLTDDKIIVTTNRGISALSIETGDVLWEYVVSGRFREAMPLQDYIVSSPIVSEGQVVVGTMAYSYHTPDPIKLGWPDEMHLMCLDEATGKEEWLVETCSGFRTSPCEVYGKVFAASREIMCIDLERGDILWSSGHKYPYDIEKPVKERYSFFDSTPALYHGILVVGSSTRQWSSAQKSYIEWQKIVFMDQYTGDILYEWVKEGVLACSPAVYQGKVHIYSYDGMVRCVSFLGGEELWKTSISEPREKELYGSRLWPSPTVADNKVYIGSIEGVFYCLDADTGDVLWKYETGGPFRSAPAVVSGRVLASSTDGSLYCFSINPTTYRTKAQEYMDSKTYDKAEEFFTKAKENATAEEIEKINASLAYIDSQMPGYEKKLEKWAEAESLMDEADKILWNSRFEMARYLYVKAYKIHKEYNNEFEASFCEMKIDYLNKKIIHYDVIFVTFLCCGIVFLLISRYTIRKIRLLNLREKLRKKLSSIAKKTAIAVIILVLTGAALSFVFVRTFSEFQITYDPSYQSSPTIYENIVVFTDGRNGNYDIYGYNLSTKEEFQITANESDQVDPAIYGDIIIWEDERNGNWDIYGYNLSTKEEFQITTDENDQMRPAIYENIVVWDDDRNGKGDIYGYDLLTRKEFQITTDPSTQSSPAIYNDIVVWHDYRNGGEDIYAHNLTTQEEFQITSDPNKQKYPSICKDIVVWQDERNGNYDIYMYNLITRKEVQITTDPHDQYGVALYGEIAVYSEFRDYSFNIYGYNVSTRKDFLIANDRYNQYDPAIYKDIIVWEDWRNENGDIFGINITLKKILAGKVVFIVLIFLVLLLGLFWILKRRFF